MRKKHGAERDGFLAYYIFEDLVATATAVRESLCSFRELGSRLFVVLAPFTYLHTVVPASTMLGSLPLAYLPLLADNLPMTMLRLRMT